MAAPLSPETCVTSFDIAEAVAVVQSTLRRFTDGVQRLALAQATGEDIGLGGFKGLEQCKAHFEVALDELTRLLAEACHRHPVNGFVSSVALRHALRACHDENLIAAGHRPRDPLATAMRRTDEALAAEDAADRFLTASAHDVGAHLLSVA